MLLPNGLQVGDRLLDESYFNFWYHVFYRLKHLRHCMSSRICMQNPRTWFTSLFEDISSVIQSLILTRHSSSSQAAETNPSSMHPLVRCSPVMDVHVT
jgi:hypothetical protein